MTNNLLIFSEIRSRSPATMAEKTILGSCPVPLYSCRGTGGEVTTLKVDVGRKYLVILQRDAFSKKTVWSNELSSIRQ